MKKSRINPFYLIGGLIAITLAVVFFSVSASGVLDTLDLTLISLTILSGFCPLYIVLGLNMSRVSEATS